MMNRSEFGAIRERCGNYTAKLRKGKKAMKKRFLLGACVVFLLMVLVGCQRQADKVSYNLSLEADNFNVVRQLTVINSRSDDVLFQMTGKMSIATDKVDNQLEVVVEDENGKYHKHFIYLNSWTTYVVEDLGGASVDKYKYTLNYNPKMWLPITTDTID